MDILDLKRKEPDINNEVNELKRKILHLHLETLKSGLKQSCFLATIPQGLLVNHPFDFSYIQALNHLIEKKIRLALKMLKEAEESLEFIKE